MSGPYRPQRRPALRLVPPPSDAVPARPVLPAPRLSPVEDPMPRLPGVPVDDPRWIEVRRGHKPGNYGRKFPAEVLSPAEMLALLRACELSRTAELVARNQALVVALWRGGLRIAEAMALLPKDVDFGNGAFRVLHGKGDKARTAGIDRPSLRYLEVWLQARKRLGIGPEVPVFCTLQPSARHGSRGEFRALTATYVRNYLHWLAAKAGIHKRVHPHGLRHTHAFELANENVPMHVIQAQLGHSDLSTTGRYITHLAPIAVLRAMQDRTFPVAGDPAPGLSLGPGD